MACVFVCVCVCLYVCIYICVCVCFYVCIHIYIYVCVCVCLFVCVRSPSVSKHLRHPGDSAKNGVMKIPQITRNFKRHKFNIDLHGNIELKQMIEQHTLAISEK